MSDAAKFIEEAEKLGWKSSIVIRNHEHDLEVDVVFDKKTGRVMFSCYDGEIEYVYDNVELAIDALKNENPDSRIP